ncbi:hypothetical protein L9F63_019528, partial [Diploptera punctata]
MGYPSVIMKPDLLREVVSKYIDHFFPNASGTSAVAIDNKIEQAMKSWKNKSNLVLYACAVRTTRPSPKQLIYTLFRSALSSSAFHSASRSSLNYAFMCIDNPRSYLTVCDFYLW